PRETLQDEVAVRENRPLVPSEAIPFRAETGPGRARADRDRLVDAAAIGRSKEEIGIRAEVFDGQDTGALVRGIRQVVPNDGSWREVDLATRCKRGRSRHASEAVKARVGSLVAGVGNGGTRPDGEAIRIGVIHAR